MSDSRYPEKYVVILEIDTGYMDCIAVCDKATEAYGEAYMALSEGLDDNSYYITLPEKREGENGYVIECRSKENNEVTHWCTVLFYREGDDAE